MGKIVETPFVNATYGDIYAWDKSRWKETSSGTVNFACALRSHPGYRKDLLEPINRFVKLYEEKPYRIDDPKLFVLAKDGMMIDQFFQVRRVCYFNQFDADGHVVVILPLYFSHMQELPVHLLAFRDEISQWESAIVTNNSAREIYTRDWLDEHGGWPERVGKIRNAVLW